MTEQTQTANTPETGLAERRQAAMTSIEAIADSALEQPEEPDTPPETTQEQSQASEEAEAPEGKEPEKAEEPKEAKEPSEERDEQDEEPADWSDFSLSDLEDDEREAFLANVTVPVTIEGQTTEVPLQEAIRGHLREATFTQKSQKLADEVREFEQTRGNAVARWQQTTEVAEAAVTSLAAVIPGDVELSQFVNEDGDVDYVAFDNAKRQADTLRNTLIEAYTQVEQVKQAREAEINEARTGYKEQQETLLRSRLPALSDPSKRRDFEDKARTYLQTAGFQVEEADNFLSNFDHRMMMVLKDALDGKNASADKGKALKRLKNLPKPNPPTAPASKKDEARTHAANLHNRLKNAKTKRSRRAAAGDILANQWGLE